MLALKKLIKTEIDYMLILELENFKVICKNRENFEFLLLLFKLKLLENNKIEIKI